MEKIPIYFDASALKDSSCFKKFWLHVVESWKPIGGGHGDYRMAFGSAIHKFNENHYKGGDRKRGMQQALDYYTPWNTNLNITQWEFRTSSNLLKICQKYHDRFANDPSDFKPLIDKDGKKQVEYKFQIKIWENEKYILYLCGTIDLICSYEGYPILLVDHKSTSSKNDQYFFKDYDWNIQTMLYSKVWREANNLDYYPPVLINGIFCKKPTKKAMDDGIFDGVEFDRSAPIQYDDDRMARFTEWINSRIKSIIYYLQNEGNPNINPLENYDMSACRKFGLCEYFDVCKLPTEMQRGALEGGFEIHKYNPLRFRD